MQFLHKGKVITGSGSCKEICGKANQICGFAQGGRKSCRDEGSTFCTCYPYLIGAEIKEPSKEEQNLVEQQNQPATTNSSNSSTKQSSGKYYLPYLYIPKYTNLITK